MLQSPAPSRQANVVRMVGIVSPLQGQCPVLIEEGMVVAMPIHQTCSVFRMLDNDFGVSDTFFDR